MFDDRLGSTFREGGKLPGSVALAASQQVAESQMKIARELRAAKAEQSDRDTARNEVDRQLEARADTKRKSATDDQRPDERVLKDRQPSDPDARSGINIVV